MSTLHRLQQYRHEAATGKWVRPLTWRDTKQHHTSPWGAPRANNVRGEKGEIFSESLDQYGVDLGTVQDVCGRRAFDHTGWYADNYQDELIVAHVCRMRCPRGTLYIPATLRTESDGTIHYLADAELVPKGAGPDDHEAAQREAARSADHYAEREAEDCRDYCAKDSAERDIEQAREAIHETNKAALVLLAVIKGTRKVGGTFSPGICGAVQSRIRALLFNRAKQFEIIREREANYWSAVTY